MLLPFYSLFFTTKKLQKRYSPFFPKLLEKISLYDSYKGLNLCKLLEALF